MLVALTSTVALCTRIRSRLIWVRLLVRRA